MAPLLIALLLIAVACWGYLRIRRRYLLKRYLAEPFPESWQEILERNIPIYTSLPPAEQQRLKTLLREFLFTKIFEGCGGLRIDDEIRVTIAAQASLLLLGGQAGCYPRLCSVLVYPSTYVARDQDGEASVRLGESWQSGSVVLAWDSARQGAVNFADGRNLVIHEFAHQLDQEDGAGDGAPILGSRSSYASWAEVLSRDYLALQKRASRGKKGLLDHYGATNSAEFFAVVSETFFEKPRQLARKHPDLFAELKSYYRVDPRDWI